MITWLLWFIIFVWFTVALMPDPQREWRPNWLRLSLAPDFVIGGHDNPYLLRWWILPRNGWCNVYLHKIIRDDDDRAIHDHPWDNASIILRGQYNEVTLEHPWADRFVTLQTVMERVGGRPLSAHGYPLRRHARTAGSIVSRKAEAAHRLELIGGLPCWTLFVSGRRRRQWGFHTAGGWIPWQQFTDPSDPGVARLANDNGVAGKVGAA